MNDRKDFLPDLRSVQANHTALMVFGRHSLDGMSRVTINSIPLSVKSFALLFADIAWLMLLKDTSQ